MNDNIKWIKNIGCPNCHSTAQVKRGNFYFSDNGEYICLPCECGCGCMFEYMYPNNPEEIFIHGIERKDG